MPNRHFLEGRCEIQRPKDPKLLFCCLEEVKVKEGNSEDVQMFDLEAGASVINSAQLANHSQLLSNAL